MEKRKSLSISAEINRVFNDDTEVILHYMCGEWTMFSLHKASNGWIARTSFKYPKYAQKETGFNEVTIELENAPEKWQAFDVYKKLREMHEAEYVDAKITYYSDKLKKAEQRKKEKKEEKKISKEQYNEIDLPF